MPSAAGLDHITDFPGLVGYLRDELEWDIPEDAHFDDVTFSWLPSEFGLDLAEPIQVTQLRPLRADQPWGVFFLNFPNRQLPVTVMRRILRGLSKRKRASANPADRAAWDKEDLLFISAVGDADDRRLSFAHFQDRGADLPTLRVIGWDKDDTVRRLSHVDELLRKQLSWPPSGILPEVWRDRWRSAFTERPREAVRTAKEMAVALAALARDIRDRIKLILPREKPDGDLKQLFEAVKQTLTRDLDFDKFADTYAQTIAYGLLSARINQTRERDEAHAERQKTTLGPKPDLAPITADAAGQAMPTTNPFLKELFGSFLSAGGRDSDGAGLDFDELGVGEVVDLLNAADMEAVLLDFDKQKAGDDPVIHFYTGFLEAYDKALKVQRGVFYTPRPVVSFIVRSVDEVLRTQFGLEDGLADTTTWAQFVATHPDVEIPEGLDGDEPFVKILDPATGTGTFLVEAIDLIHSRMMAKWTAEGLNEKQRLEAWNAYVPAHLLARLYGFEIMMAPYAVAHMKIGLKLADTGYRFEGEGGDGHPARARVFLTNALEPAQDLDVQLSFVSEALAHEAKAANEAKGKTRFSVVVGNPPYAESSEVVNRTKDERGRLNYIGHLLSTYYMVNSININERNSKAISSDENKFIRLSHEFIRLSGQGVFGLITPHGYLDGKTMRGIRWNISDNFNQVWVLNLHGNVNRREKPPNGGVDKGIFDIKQGVAITVASRSSPAPRNVRLLDAWGTREKKNVWLHSNKIGNEFQIIPGGEAPWVGPSNKIDDAYATWPSLLAIFMRRGNGFKTHRDHVATAYTADELNSTVESLVGSIELDDDLLERWGFKSSTSAAGSNLPEWNIAAARLALRDRTHVWSDIVRTTYFPLDFRYSYHHSALMDRPRKDVLAAISHGSVGMVTTMQTKDMWGLLSVNVPFAHKLVGAYDTNYVFPLYNFSTTIGMRSNLNTFVTDRIARLTNLVFDDSSPSPRQGSPEPDVSAGFAARHALPFLSERGDLRATLGVRDVFDWVYAVLYAPSYRERYADFLKSDFARVPLPKDRAFFDALVPLGTELVALHLLDPVGAQVLNDPKVRFVNPNGVLARLDGRKIETRRTSAGRAYVNDGCWFETVPESVWNRWIGGYQPAQKWLKDRAAKGGKKASAGRVLTPDDQLHYRRMIVALERTAEIMTEIDQVIDRHGGWPGAFKGMTD